MSDFLKIIRLRMAELGMNQSEVADKAGMSRVSFSDIMTGKTQNPRQATLEKIASALGITFDDLVSEEPPVGRGIRAIVPRELSVVYDEELIYGLKDLLEDEVSMRMMSVTEEEIKWMKTIRFRIDHKPTKETYINMLFEYRKLDEE